MRVTIATPVYGETMSTGCHISIIDTLRFFGREFPHIGFSTRVLSTSFFPTARNVLASNFLADPTATHLLFVDSDMSFSPELVAKMLAFGKPVVGAIYPEKPADFDAFRRSIGRTSSPLHAQMAAVSYVYGGDAILGREGRDGKREIEVIDGFVRVRRAGTGIVMIAREALETIREKMPDLWVATPSEWLYGIGLSREAGYIQCFDVVPQRDGTQIGSDVAFSDRWVQGCGGEIWSCVDEAIVRSGADNFVGHYLTHLQSKTDEGRVIVTSTSGEAAGGAAS